MIMIPIRMVAIPTEVVEKVRRTMRAPFHGFPAHAELATDEAPCRHCLRTFVAGRDRRILFTYDRFAGVETLPQPGPVYVHEEVCPRYEGDSGFPEELRRGPRTLEAYGRGRHLLGQFFGKTRIDRKSTRLNSSHVATSYAVFCLKKKKKVRTCTTRNNSML